VCAGIVWSGTSSVSTCMSHPSLRASTPIARNRHIYIPSAPPIGLYVACSSSIGFTILSERSSLSPGKRLHHQRSSSSHDASPHPQGGDQRLWQGKII
jgi:hypothetical protein